MVVHYLRLWFLRVSALTIMVSGFWGRSGAAQLDMAGQPRPVQMVFSGEKTDLSVEWHPDGEAPATLKATLVQLTSGHKAILWKGRELAVLVPDKKKATVTLEIPAVETETRMELYWAAYEGDRLVVSTTMFPLLALPPRPKARAAFAAAVRTWLDAHKLDGIRVESGRAEMEGLFRETHLLTDRTERALALLGSTSRMEIAACPLKIFLLQEADKPVLAVYESHTGKVRWPTPLADTWDEALFLHHFVALLNALDESPNKEKK